MILFFCNFVPQTTCRYAGDHRSGNTDLDRVSTPMSQATENNNLSLCIFETALYLGFFYIAIRAAYVFISCSRRYNYEIYYRMNSVNTLVKFKIMVMLWYNLLSTCKL